MSTKAIDHNENWTEVIEPRTSLLDLRLTEVWRYRDLLMLLVKRDFVATYKQTILGPVWFFLQPVLTTIVFTVIFGGIAGISTGGIPKMLFYLAGLTLWNYFAECLNRTATVFKDNAQVFGKVYFPRLVMPLSIVVSNLVKLGIQFALFMGFWVYFRLTTMQVHPNSAILLTPVLVLIMGMLGLGFGMIISAMTTKYRDLVYLLGFGVQLLMYTTPVIIPLAEVKPQNRWLFLANPMSSIIETFRYAFTGSGTLSIQGLAYSAAIAIAALVIGTITFNRVERSFMDTV